MTPVKAIAAYDALIILWVVPNVVTFGLGVHALLRARLNLYAIKIIPVGDATRAHAIGYAVSQCLLAVSTTLFLLVGVIAASLPEPPPDPDYMGARETIRWLLVAGPWFTMSASVTSLVVAWKTDRLGVTRITDPDVSERQRPDDAD